MKDDQIRLEIQIIALLYATCVAQVDRVVNVRIRCCLRPGGHCLIVNPGFLALIS